MVYNELRPALFFLAHALPIISALGINCRGSILCGRASLSNQQSVGIIQILRDVIWASPMSNSTTYASGDHVICLSQSQPIDFDFGAEVDGISGGIGLSINSPQGGICLFPQYLTVANLNLGQIRPLVDAILEHGCGPCGSVPIHFVDEGSNDPSDGILTFNYVKSPFCVGNCISDTGSLPSSSTASFSSSTTPSPSAAAASSSSTTSSSSSTTPSPTAAAASSSSTTSFSSSTSPSATASSSSTATSSGIPASANGPTTVTEAPPTTVTETGPSATTTSSSKSTGSRLRGWRCGTWTPILVILSYMG